MLWKDNAFFKRLGKRLDAHVADKLLRDGRVRLKDCKSAKGKTYNATVLLAYEADGRSKFSVWNLKVGADGADKKKRSTLSTMNAICISGKTAQGSALPLITR